MQVHTHTHSHTYARAYTRTHAHTRAHALTHAHIHSPPPTHTRSHALTRTHAHIHTHTERDTHTLTHTQAHTHTHLTETNNLKISRQQATGCQVQPHPAHVPSLTSSFSSSFSPGSSSRCVNTPERPLFAYIDREEEEECWRVIKFTSVLWHFFGCVCMHGCISEFVCVGEGVCACLWVIGGVRVSV